MLSVRGLRCVLRAHVPVWPSGNASTSGVAVPQARGYSTTQIENDAAEAGLPSDIVPMDGSGKRGDSARRVTGGGKLPSRQRFCTGPYEEPGKERPAYPKRRTPFARAKALISALHAEEGLRMIQSGRSKLAAMVPPVRTGEIIRVQFGPREAFTGIVMATRKRGLGSGLVLRNVVDGVAIERAIPLYDPSVTEVTRVGRRKVRRNKLYYLREKKLRESTFEHKHVVQKQ